MGLFVNGDLTKLKFIIINFRIKKENLKKIGILLIHGLWEHQGRHDINASWFKNLNIDFIDNIGLREHLSPTRANGLVSMVKQIKMYAVAFQTQLN